VIELMNWLATNVPRMGADFWHVLADMAPYLLLGFAVAGLLSVLVSARTVERHLGGRGIWPVVKAAAFGVPLPLCSCSVIPVSASLRRHGASKGATTSFLISTPETGVDSIMVTWSLLGGVFAIFRVVAAFVSGVVGGALVALLTRGEKADAAAAPPCDDACCAELGAGDPPRRGRALRALEHAFVTLPRDIGKPLLLGLLVAAVISVVLPPNAVAGLLGGGGGPLAIAVMMLAGIPIYVCATASVPIAAALVLTQGISPGAAFAFLVTGPATNAATIATIWRIMGLRTATIYLLTIAATAFVGGLALDQLVSAGDVVAAGEHMGWMVPHSVAQVLAVVLLALLAWPIVASLASRLGRRPAADDGGSAEYPQRVVLTVAGMTCGHCAAAVRSALAKVPGVTSVEMDLSAGLATVSGGSFDEAQLRQAVAAAGFSADAAGQSPQGSRPGS
jgi:uncharacterized membrane protein YraQ (UPF0718 family)/copper chaperone CopZ